MCEQGNHLNQCFKMYLQWKSRTKRVLGYVHITGLVFVSQEMGQGEAEFTVIVYVCMGSLVGSLYVRVLLFIMGCIVDESESRVQRSQSTPKNVRFIIA